MDNLQINKPLEDIPGKVGAEEQGVHVCALYVVSSSANSAIRETFLLFDTKWFIHY